MLQTDILKLQVKYAVSGSKTSRKQTKRDGLIKLKSIVCFFTMALNNTLQHIG